MTMPKRKSRLITVAGEVFRFMITGMASPVKDEGYLCIVVEHAQEGASVLKAGHIPARDYWFDCSLGYPIDWAKYPVITPALAGLLLIAGW